MPASLQPKSPINPNRSRESIPVPPPTVPTQQLVPEVTVAEATTDFPQPNGGGDRKLRRRKTKSLEKEIVLSDSDEEALPTIKHSPSYVDEPDASVEIDATAVTSISAISTVDEPAICIDNAAGNDATTFSDRSQLSYDDILKIEESFEEDGAADVNLNETNQSIIVEIHSEPQIELKIHESDSDPNISPQKDSSHHVAFTANKSAKDIFNIADHSGSYSEDDALDRETCEKPERLVQSDSEILSKTPLELIVECDINENVIVSDLDHNHNDVVKSIETDSSSNSVNTAINVGEVTELARSRESTPPVEQIEQRRESISSQSSFDESDAAEAEPMYATVDKSLEVVSAFDFVDFMHQYINNKKRERKKTY